MGFCDLFGEYVSDPVCEPASTCVERACGTPCYPTYYNLWPPPIGRCDSDGMCITEGEPNCGNEAGPGENCGADINVACKDGLYCAFGGNWCGTPPVTGMCLSMGTCNFVSDCENGDNLWTRARCEGSSACEEGTCVWHCRM